MYTVSPPGVDTADEHRPEGSGEITLTVAPNPTRGAAVVRLTLASPEEVRVRVLDVLGREVAVLTDGPQAAGAHAFAMPGVLAAGIYAVEATAGERRTTGLVTVIR